MPSPFASLLRSVQADGYRPSLTALGVGVGLLLLWLGWFLLGRVPVHAVSGEARLVVSTEAHPVEAPMGGGRIARLQLELGQLVREGQVLLELEADAQRLLLQESTARWKGLGAQRTALTRQLAAEEDTDAREREAARLTLGEARLRQQVADEGARLAAQELERTRELLSKGLASQAEFERANGVARERRMEAETLKLGVERESVDTLRRGSTRRARIEELQRQLADVEGALAEEEARRSRLEYDLEHRKVRAPVAGRVGEAAPLSVGTQLQGGERLGSIIPSGELKVVADFPPSEAVGRIQQGQTARVRLDGFPWTQYGTIAARVSRVASEARDRRIRVECALEPGASSAIPFQHGLTGAVEIEVERTSPALLVLRAAGLRLTAGRAR